MIEFNEEARKELESHRINDAKIETLLSSLHTTQQQFVYYILAITAACIGFTITSTTNNLVDINLLAGGIAILFWILSFIFGVLQLSSIERHIKYNMASLLLFKHNAVNKKVDEKMGEINVWKNRFRILQNIFLIIGAIGFIFWHTQKIINYTKQYKKEHPTIINKP